MARKPDVFVNLFNNVYSTNFAQWIEGSWSLRVRLWVPEPSQLTEESLIGDSWEARSACLAAVCDAPPGDLPPVAAGLTITKRPEDAAHAARPIVSGGLCRGLLVTAFGPNPYGEGTLLRLWEQVGMQGTVTVRLPAGFKARRVQPCDLRGQPLGPPFNLSQQGIFQLPIKPMAPTSAVLVGGERR